MKRLLMAVLAGALVLGAPAVALAQAKPAAKPAAKGPTPEEKAMDRAVASTKKGKGGADAKSAKKK